ncbi:retinol dehydrogenase 8-like [Lytechinus pictus]|uniref:retinol dehydrogenase 8-like n=1 Tax=Lytechinus pictus TaxID=7653 RepID=UPI0030B9D83B
MPLVVFITGCSSGIGLTTAATLAKDPSKRFLVYATILKVFEEETRFQEAVDGKQILDQTLFPIQMDITNDESVRDAVATVMKQQGRIDILVNNAGVAMINVSETASVEQAKKLFDINFFGNFRVTKEILPGMKKQRSGRIINISSNNGIFCNPYLGLYAATKQAIEAFSQETAIIGRFFDIWVSVIEPGPVDTPIRETIISSGMGGVEHILQTPDIDDLDKRLVRYFEVESEYHGHPMQQPEEIAEIVIEAATAEKPHFRYQSSKVPSWAQATDNAHAQNCGLLTLQYTISGLPLPLLSSRS